MTMTTTTKEELVRRACELIPQMSELAAELRALHADVEAHVDDGGEPLTVRDDEVFLATGVQLDLVASCLRGAEWSQDTIAIRREMGVM
jgi:hypothetical protein